MPETPKPDAAQHDPAPPSAAAAEPAERKAAGSEAGPAFALHLVTLAVADLARAAAFYDAIGLPRRLKETPGVAFFAAGSVLLSLYPQEDLAQDAGAEIPPAAGAGRITLACNVRREEEVRVVLERALAAGATCLRQPFRAAWGGTVSYFADPDGHAWEVTYAPGFAFDADGRLVVPELAGTEHAA